jgi:hypothetical protein
MSTLRQTLDELEAGLQALVERGAARLVPGSSSPTEPSGLQEPLTPTETAGDLGDTAALELPPEQPGDAPPANAFLIVDGSLTYPLTGSVVNIGRRADNDLVLHDPRVSRNHAQLRAIKGRYVIFDLDSTAGTFVNGQRVAQSATLFSGDVISLAGATLIFGQDSFDPDTTQPIYTP